MQRAVRRIAHGVASLICLFITLVPSWPTYADGAEVDLALVLAVDCSSSVDEEEFSFQMAGLGRAFQQAEVKAAIRHGPLQRIAVSVVEWSGLNNHVTAMPWTIITSDDEAERFGAAVARLPRGLAPSATSVSSALLYSDALLDRAPRATRRVIDVSADGPNNVGGEVKLARDKLVEKGITINALAILNEWRTLDSYFRNEVTGGEGSFVVPAKDYNAYAEAIYAKLMKEIIGPGIS